MSKKYTKYRKIWQEHFGPIPKDEHDRSYEIHHIDGNRKNNKIENLKCISIQEHYDLHHSQGDWNACLAISMRMGISPEEKSFLAKKASETQLKLGKHNFQKRSDGSSLSKDRVNNGTHNWLGDGSYQREIQLNKISEGTHHFLGGKQSKINSNKMVKEGTHPFMKRKDGSSLQKDRVKTGTHHFLKKIQCPHCHKFTNSGNFFQWHGERCKHKN